MSELMGVTSRTDAVSAAALVWMPHCRMYAASDATLCVSNWFWVGLHTSQRSSIHTVMLMRG
jgi:hypothetical protein